MQKELSMIIDILEIVKTQEDKLKNLASVLGTNKITILDESWESYINVLEGLTEDIERDIINNATIQYIEDIKDLATTLKTFGFDLTREELYYA